MAHDRMEGRARGKAGRRARQGAKHVGAGQVGEQGGPQDTEEVQNRVNVTGQGGAEGRG